MRFAIVAVLLVLYNLALTGAFFGTLIYINARTTDRFTGDQGSQHCHFMREMHPEAFAQSGIICKGD